MGTESGITIMVPPALLTSEPDALVIGGGLKSVGNDQGSRAQALTRLLAPTAHAGQPLAALTARVLDRAAWARIVLVTDLIMLAWGAGVLTLAAPVAVNSVDVLLATLFCTVAVAMLHSRSGADYRLHASTLDTSMHALGAISSAAILTLAAASIIEVSHPVQLTLRLWLCAAVYLPLVRVVLANVRARALRNDALATPTLIVGAGMIGEHVAKRLISEPAYGLRPVGFLDSDPAQARGCGEAPAVPLLGGPDDMTEAIRQTGARRVILAFSREPDHLLVERVRECERIGVEVSLVPRLFELVNDRATYDAVGGLPLFSLRPTNPHCWQFSIKHVADRTLAAMSLIVLAPLMGLIAVAVRLTSPGPALFHQERVGRDGRVFDVLKFRTMREPDPRHQTDFEPPVGCAPGGIEGEDRRTRLGRWLRSASVDELPQLINVLRGEMSIVGPRPERPQFAARFGADVDRYDDRLRVKSGITGWAQVNGLRGQTSIADRVEWDNAYIRNWSLGLDFKIMLLTIAEIARLRDSQRARKYASGSRFRARANTSASHPDPSSQRAACVELPTADSVLRGCARTAGH